MPKQKTHSGAKKKFKVTGTGKLIRRSANQHSEGKKSPKQKREFTKAHSVDGDNEKTVNRMLGRR
jgi:large subunit ribosomal protein L35